MKTVKIKPKSRDTWTSVQLDSEVSDITRSGWSAARICDTIPPIECPIRWQRSIPSASSSESLWTSRIK